MTRSKVIYFLLPVIILLFNTGNSKANDLKEIVLLSSYHIGFKWSSDIDQAITNHFKKNESTRLFHEFMDSKRFNNENYFEALKQTYFLKYNNHKVDGVICIDNRAFEFFMKNGEEIWGDVPAVFCGVNNIEEYASFLKKNKHAVVLENIDIQGTIELISQLQPDIKEIIAISDQTLSGLIFLDQFKTGIQAYTEQIQYRTIDASNPEFLKNQLTKLKPGNNAIYLLSLYTNRNGIANEMLKESTYFFDDINIPVYSNWDFLMPGCIVGGKILTGADQGKHAAKLLEMLLNGEKVPQFTSPSQKNIFDYEKLKEFNVEIPETVISYQIINKPRNFINEFRNELIIILSILTSLLFIIILLISNMIKRKKVELDLIKSEKRLELAVDGANEGLWDIDFSTKELYFNDRFALLLGYNSLDELNITIDNWMINIHANDIKRVEQAFNLHKHGKTEAFRCEVRLRMKNGKYAWFSILGKITEKWHDSTIRITGIIQNINNQKEFENELRVAKERAEESDRLKSSFLANMSHEIRTPMNAILGFTDLLMESDMTENEKTEYLSMIKKSGENLLSLINDIIDISKIESGQLKINLQMTDLHSMLKDLSSLGNTLINTLNKNIELRLLINNIDDKLDIRTDHLRLYQILLNLISNAIKFTDHGYIDISYRLLDDQHIEISVKDTGPGISESDQSIIFERFRQIDESTIKKHGGTGLGLFICKSLVELMNGSIEVKSPKSGGAQFLVALPCLISETVAANK